jgi:asparagine synthase (glutamine-hydrolysing)
MKVDRTTMAHSLEARVPYLDHRVVELAFRMPSSLELRHGIGKAVLRTAARPRLGDELTMRRKHGFDLPMGEWLRGELREPVLGTFAPARQGDCPWLDYGRVRELIARHERRFGEFERPIWMLWVLARWFAGVASACRREPISATIGRSR